MIALADTITVSGVQVLLVAIGVLFLGQILTRRIGFLGSFNIPPPLTGGLCASGVLAVVHAVSGTTVQFDTSMRDVLLMVFFSTVGLSAKFRRIIAGGRALLILFALTVVFLLLQNLAGTLAAVIVGYKPAAGLIGGSIALAGGHGTAITWGNVLRDHYGLPNAPTAGIAVATVGLLLGGMLGGPLARVIMRRNGISGSSLREAETPGGAPLELGDVSAPGAIHVVFALALCVESGSLAPWISDAVGLQLPGFLVAMLTAVVLTNLADKVGIALEVKTIRLVSEISLLLFLAMSLMSIQLWLIAEFLLPLTLCMAIQVALIFAYGYFVMFRALGRNYDACCITAGFVGLGLGATPVGIANINAITSRYGPSPEAYLVLPILGASLLDITNAVVIQSLLSLPFYS